MILTADKAFKESQKGIIRESKKDKKRNKKEFRLAMKTIYRKARLGETDTCFYYISYSTEGKLNKLGYKTKYYGNRVNVSWKDAETSVTGREGKVSAWRV